MANVEDKVKHIRTSQRGRDVREAIASGIEVINVEVEGTTKLAEEKAEEMNALKKELDLSEIDRRTYHEELQEKVESGYFKGEKGDQGEKGERGDPGTIENATAKDIGTSDNSNVQEELDTIKANEWVTTPRLTDLSVTNAKLATSSVTSPKIANNSVTSAKLAPSAKTTIIFSVPNVANGVSSLNIPDVSSYGALVVRLGASVRNCTTVVLPITNNTSVYNTVAFISNDVGLSSAAMIAVKLNGTTLALEEHWMRGWNMSAIRMYEIVGLR